MSKYEIFIFDTQAAYPLIDYNRIYYRKYIGVIHYLDSYYDILVPK